MYLIYPLPTFFLTRYMEQLFKKDRAFYIRIVLADVANTVSRIIALLINLAEQRETEVLFTERTQKTININ